jgi:hypothetical protein
MYTLSSTGGLVSCLTELDNKWLLAGHVTGALSAWRLCPAGTKESEDLWDGEVLGLEK